MHFFRIFTLKKRPLINIQDHILKESLIYFLDCCVTCEVGEVFSSFISFGTKNFYGKLSTSLGQVNGPFLNFTKIFSLLF